MKNTLTHLSHEKQQELKTVVAAIRAHPEVEMIILFGSHASGKDVEDLYEEDGILYHYQSDYDLLVVVKTRGLQRQQHLEFDLMETVEKLPNIHTPCSIIVHDADYINAQLDDAQYFFSDIKKKGILLYSTGHLKLKEVNKQLNPKQRYQLAQEDFEYWFTDGVGFYEGFNFYLQGKKNNLAAFSLHQATERFYNAILLVFTHYKPKTHDLAILRRLTNNLDRRFIKIFVETDPEERRLFRLLREAYIAARYKKGYKITEDELNRLSERVQTLQQLTEKLCHEKMESFLVN
ncbi:MAG TPA: HEPN domain-containing protein [Gammaproteobacteria bacterium]|nr:HEPN domain-containing protein [Gammaproteobacteria bacterium]